MIPKIIHYCWVGGKNMPEEVKIHIETCKKHNPDYKIIIWNEKNFNIEQNTYAKEAYLCKKWAFVSDYIRLKVLYDYGGIYMDTDVEVVKPLDVFLKNKAFSGFESKSGRIPTGTIGAEKGNKWIKILLDYYQDKHFVRNDRSLDVTTNVRIITELTTKSYPLKLNNKYQELEDVTFYPFDYLCAKEWMSGKIQSTNNTYTIHHFAGSWRDKQPLAKKIMCSILGEKLYTKLSELRMILK